MPTTDEPLVGEVGDCFRCHRESRWGVGPPHGKLDGECDKRRFGGEVWHDHTKLRDAGGAEIDAVETVGQIYLEKVDLSLGRVGKENTVQEAIKGPTELHGVHGYIRLGGWVDTVKGVVDDGAGTACMLGHDAHGVETEAANIADCVVFHDYPKLLVDVVGHVFTQEVLVFVCGLVRSASDASVEFYGRQGGTPWRWYWRRRR